MENQPDGGQDGLDLLLTGWGSDYSVGRGEAMGGGAATAVAAGALRRQLAGPPERRAQRGTGGRRRAGRHPGRRPDAPTVVCGGRSRWGADWAITAGLPGSAGNPPIRPPGSVVPARSSSPSCSRRSRTCHWRRTARRLFSPCIEDWATQITLPCSDVHSRISLGRFGRGRSTSCSGPTRPDRTLSRSRRW